MSTMRAVQVVGYHQDLQMAEVPVPEVGGPFDVVVRIGGAGVCRTDLHILEGQWAEKSQVALPYTIGHENAGWVHAVGSAVTNVAEGDKVIVHPLITCGLCRACRSGDDVHCESNAFPGISTNGGYAEYLGPRPAAGQDRRLPRAVGRRRAGRRRPHGLPRGGQGGPPADAARPLRRYRRRRPRPHRHPGAQGAQPGRVIVVDRNPDAVKLASSIGADHGIVANGTQVEQVLELTGGSAPRWSSTSSARAARPARASGCSAGRRLPRRRLRREHPRPDDRHRLDRDQHHRQPRGVLQRPVRPHGARRPRRRHPAHPEVRARRLPERDQRPRRGKVRGPGHPDALTARPCRDTPGRAAPLAQPVRPTPEDPLIYITVKFPIRPEKADAFLDEAAAYTAATRAEEGNVFFEWSRSVDEPDTFVLLEGFRDAAAGSAHVAGQHVQDFFGWAPDWVTASPRSSTSTPPDITGFGPMGEISRAEQGPPQRDRQPRPQSTRRGSAIHGSRTHARARGATPARRRPGPPGPAAASPRPRRAAGPAGRAAPAPARGPTRCAGPRPP